MITWMLRLPLNAKKPTYLPLFGYISSMSPALPDFSMASERGGAFADRLLDFIPGQLRHITGRRLGRVKRGNFSLMVMYVAR